MPRTAHGLSVRSQLIALVALSGLVTALMFAFGLREVRLLRTEILSALTTANQAQARKFAASLQQLRHDARFLARLQTQTHEADLIQAFLASHPAYLGVYTLKPDQGSDGATDNPYSDARTQHQIALLMSQREDEVRIFGPSERQGRATLTAAVAGRRGAPLTLVEFDLGARLNDAVLTVNGERYLFDSKAHLLAQGERNGDNRGLPAVQRLIAENPDLTRGTTLFEAHSYVSMQRLMTGDSGDPDVILAIVRAEPPALAHLERGVYIVVIAAALVTIILTIVGIQLLRSQQLPLTRLTETLYQIATGNFTAPLPAITTRGRLGALAAAVKELRGSVAAREQSLRNSNRELEARADARGSELELAANVVRNTSEGVMITNAEGIIVSVNPAFTEITGHDATDAVGAKPSLLKSGRHDAHFYTGIWLSLLSQGQWRGELWNRRKNGEDYLQQLTINMIPGARGLPAYYVGVFRDITAVRRRDADIRHLAFHDALTGLPNRALLHDRLDQAILRARRNEDRIALLFVDLDRFKSVNDSLGHDIGDRLLQTIATRLSARLRSSDTIARMGGDEFVALLDKPGSSNATAATAVALIDAVGEAVCIDGHRILVGASIGIACFPEDGDDAFTLMKHADTAMYAAKEAGRGQYRFFRHSMREAAERRLDMEVELRDAIGTRQIEVHYQPKVNLLDGRPYGVEALVRWRHPRMGLVHPSDFIPLAEESSLIVDLGNQVLDLSCRQAANWYKRGIHLPIAVNVSARQFSGSDLTKRIGDILRYYKLPPGMLQLEVTESALMANPEDAIATLQALRGLGIRVAVDDFGTGYSSLAYLRRLPMDSLKIDRSFVMAADRNHDDAELVRTIVTLAQSLRLEVIAEGVETEAQVELLRNAGCTQLQGFHFCRPLAASDLEQWLNRAGPPPDRNLRVA